MRSPQTLTQRIVPALAVTVVATLLFGAVVVTADAATDSAPLLPDTFGVAAPRQGDAWRYNVTLSGAWTFGADDDLQLGNATRFGEFQWAGRATVRGGDGLLHDVNRLEANHLDYQPLRLQSADDEDDYYDGESGQSSQRVCKVTGEDEDGERQSLCASDEPYWSDTNSSAWVLAGGRTVVSRGQLVSEFYNETTYGPIFGPVSPGVGAQYVKSVQEDGLVQYPDGEVPCFAFNPLQGGNVSLGGDIGLFDGCTLGTRFLQLPDGLAFHAADIETVSGVQAVRLDAQGNGTYSAWFTPAVPYPVRVAFSLPSQRSLHLQEGDLDEPGARRAVLEMVGFSAGTEPLDLADDPADAQAAPAFEPAPWQMLNGHRIGPSEAGVQHPFPLSVAMAEAYNASTFADLRVYLNGHPDAYVSGALYGEGMFAPYTQGSMVGRVSGWSITLTDGDEDFAFVAAKQAMDGYLPVAARGQAEQPPLYSFQRGYGYGVMDMELVAYGAPRPSEAPALLPTVQSLMARWAAFDGSGLAANTWGFTIGCEDRADEADACRTAVTVVSGVLADTYGYSSASGMPVQYLPFPIPTNPYGTEQAVHTMRVAFFDGAGLASAKLVHDEREYRSDAQGTLPGNPPLEPPVHASGDPGYSVQSVAVSGIPSAATQWIPEPKEAAGIGFLGLVVGALYWIWPKLGLVGLFSRLERGELLDHPARAKLVQIVEAQPGIHFHDLALKAELANGTAVHHLRKLSDSGHLSVRRSGRYTCYFPGGRVDPHAAAAAPLLKSDGAKQVLEAVRGKPGMSNLEVAQATGLQPSTVNYHVQRLSQAGLVAALRDGRSVRLHPGIRAGGLDGAPAAGAAA